MSKGIFNLENKEEAVFSYQLNNKYRLGIFNLNNTNKLNINLKDGTYINRFNDLEVVVNKVK